MSTKKHDRSEADTVRDLVAKAKELGLVPEDLDDRIHDLKSDEASDINNDGLQGQIKYLYECSGKDRVLEILEKESLAKKIEKETIEAGKKARGEI